jgi:hypothetical protein
MIFAAVASMTGRSELSLQGWATIVRNGASAWQPKINS